MATDEAAPRTRTHFLTGIFNTVYTCTLTESGYHCKRKTVITSLYLPMIFKYVSIQKVDDL